MNYTFDGKNFRANEGYVFFNNTNGYIYKILRLTKYDSIESYEVIPEPIEEEIETIEENTEIQ